MKPICAFLEECCLIARNARFPGRQLYLAYVHWCLEEGVPVQDQFTFVELLGGYGIRYRHKRHHDYFKGVAVLPHYRVPVAPSEDD